MVVLNKHSELAKRVNGHRTVGKLDKSGGSIHDRLKGG